MKRVVPPTISFIPINTPETERNLRLAYSRVINIVWERLQRRMRLLEIDYINTITVFKLKSAFVPIKIINPEIFIEAKCSEYYYGLN